MLYADIIAEEKMFNTFTDDSRSCGSPACRWVPTTARPAHSRFLMASSEGPSPAMSLRSLPVDWSTPFRACAERMVHRSARALSRNISSTARHPQKVVAQA